MNGMKVVGKPPHHLEIHFHMCTHDILLNIGIYSKWTEHKIPHNFMLNRTSFPKLSIHQGDWLNLKHFSIATNQIE